MRFQSMEGLLTSDQGKAVSKQYVEVCKMIDDYQRDKLKEYHVAIKDCLCSLSHPLFVCNSQAKVQKAAGMLTQNIFTKIELPNPHELAAQQAAAAAAGQPGSAPTDPNAAPSSAETKDGKKPAAPVQQPQQQPAQPAHPNGVPATEKKTAKDAGASKAGKTSTLKVKGRTGSKKGSHKGGSKAIDRRDSTSTATSSARRLALTIRNLALTSVVCSPAAVSSDMRPQPTQSA